jgi:hypothetical protein
MNEYKLQQTLNKKVNSILLGLLPSRIQYRCIQNAKTREAKRRLVFAAKEAAIEDMKRLYIRGYKHYAQEKFEHSKIGIVIDTLKNILFKK